MFAGTVMAAFVVPFVPVPNAAAWPYLLGSILAHNFYYFFLLRAYAHGDLSHVYPISRGIGPLLVAALSGRLAGEYLSTVEAVGIGLVSGGIASLALSRGWPRGGEWRPLLYALGTGVAIASYTMVDGLGARASGDAFKLHHLAQHSRRAVGHPGRHLETRCRLDPLYAPALVAWGRGRHHRDDRLCDRDLGDEHRRDGPCRRVARDVGIVRRDHGGRVAARRLRGSPHCRGLAGGGRSSADEFADFQVETRLT